MVGMDTEQTVVAAILAQLFFRDPAFQKESSVKGESGVPLRKNESVAIRIVRIGDSKRATVQRGDDVGNGESRADVPDVSALGSVEDDAPDLAR
jgi:hypothetical protein